MIPLVWYLFVLLTPTTSVSVNGPIETEAQCHYVEKQMAKLHPIRLACIEVPLKGN